jgi:hypothetical protein
MAYFTGLDRAFTPCSPETFDRGLRRISEFEIATISGQCDARPSKLVLAVANK